MWAARTSGWKLLAIGSVATLGIAVWMSPPEGRTAHELEMQAKLEAAWHQRHPGPPLPPECDADDNLGSGELEIDDSPGRELIIASDRLGIAMYAESGELLAFADPRGCRDVEAYRWFNDELLGGQRYPGIVLREDSRGGCRSTGWVRLYRRQGDTLVATPPFRERDFDQCKWDGTHGTEVRRQVERIETYQHGVKLVFTERCTSDVGGCEHEGVTRRVDDCTIVNTGPFRGFHAPSCRPILD
jgi:hypothetical protein